MQYQDELSQINFEDKSLSIIMYGENKEKAYEAAEKLFAGRIEEGKDVWKKNFQGHDIFGYVRWPESTPEESIFPKSPIYGFYFNMIFNEEEYSFTEADANASRYINECRGIPRECTLLCREYNVHGSYAELTYMSKSDNEPKFSTKIFENVVTLHNQIKRVFDDIDVNKNGTIDAQELKKVLNLNENSDMEEAEKSLKEISEKEVTFEIFRNWFFKKEDYNDLTYVVGAKVRKFELGDKFKKLFGACEAEVKKMSKEEKANEFNSKFRINTTNDFIPGVELDFKLQAGDRVADMVEDLPEFAKKEEMVLCINIGAKNEGAAKVLKQTLEMIKGMAFQALGKLKEKITIKFLVENNQGSFQVGIYVMLKQDESLDEIKTILSAYDLSNLHLNSGFDFNFKTGVCPADLLKDNFETLIKKVSNINLSAKSVLKFSIISKFMMTYMKEWIKEGEGQRSINCQFRVLMAGLAFLRMIPHVDTKIDLHEDDVIPYIKELGDTFPEAEFGKLKELVDGKILLELRGMFTKMQDMFSEQAEGFRSGIEAIDFTKIAICVVAKPVSFMGIFTVMINGMDKVINKFFGNETE